MHPNRYVIAASAVLVAACSQVQPAVPSVAPNGVASNAVMVDFGAANGRTATLNINPPADAAHYVIQAATTAHHWVAADISEYDVTLMSATTDHNHYAALSPAVLVTLPTTGAPGVAKTQAVFQNLAQGQYYRAFVVATGRQGGAAGAVGADPTFKQLNVIGADPTKFANPTTLTDFKDFDFTDTQAVTIDVPKVVTIKFDGVDFSGTGEVTFGTPTDGVFNSPSPAPAGRATTAPNNG